MMRYLKQSILLVVTMLVLAGCGGASGPEPKRYGLSSESVAGSIKGKRQRSVRLAKPTAPQGLSGRSIQVQKASGELTVVENALWVDPLPDLLASTMAEALRSRGLTVIEQGQAGRASVQVNTSIERFTVVYDQSGAAVAQVAISFTVLGLPGKKPLSTAHYEVQKPVYPLRMAGITAAYEEALAEALSKLLKKL
jgi:ABC-type uncharacterized transport system auxiliary subunit